MKLHRYLQAEAFYEQVKGYLLQHEAENNLLLRIARTLARTPEQMNDRVYLAMVGAESSILAVAIHTPPYPFCLSKVADFRAIEPIVRDAIHITPESVSGLPQETIVFTQQWRALIRTSPVLNNCRLIYQLQQVEPLTPVSGRLRLATEADRPLLLQWIAAFEAEALGVGESAVDAIVDRRLAQQSLYLWQDPEPVCMVGGMGMAGEAGTIAPVYTPPEQRKRGYATTAVAALSQVLLDRGCHYCFLFADSLNPTANHVYRSIGYQQICEWHEYGLGNSS